MKTKLFSIVLFLTFYTLVAQVPTYVPTNGLQPGASLGGFFGYRFENNIAVGYAYDNSINKFSANNNGCHTFYMSFKLEDLFENHYGYGTF